MLAIGMTGESCRHALARGGRARGGLRVGRAPSARVRGLRRRRRWRSCASCRAHPKVRAIGEAGLDYKRDYAPREDQRRCVRRPDRAGARAAAGRSSSTRARPRTTRSTCSTATATGVAVIIHCFSLTDRVDECVERGYFCSFAGNVTYPKATDLQQAAAAIPDELLLAETDAPFLSPQERRSKPNEPAYVAATARFLAELRGTPPEEMETTADAQRRAALRLVSETRDEPRPPRAARHPAQPRAGPELPRRRQHPRGDRPHRGAGPRRRRARDRRRARRAERLPRPARAAPARDRDRPAARARAARGARRPRGHDEPRDRRRDEDPPQRPRPAAAARSWRTCPTASRRPAHPEDDRRAARARSCGA